MDPLGQAVLDLASIGIGVVKVPEPWLNLYQVTGRGELTRGQVLDLARQKFPAPDMPRFQTKPA